MKNLVICDSLLDQHKEINTWQFCAPALIANTFFGLHLSKDEDLVFDDFGESSIRSGTLTFVLYKGEYFALTCKHVLDALEERQANWKNNQREKYNYNPLIDGYHLFTPIGNKQYHFNYKLVSVPLRADGSQPDVAIARIKHHSITRLGRKPIVLCQKNLLPETGIASGYPEQQRTIQKGNKINTFSPHFTSCIATMQITQKGDILLQDNIGDHKGLDSLSGMSGGPIIWSDKKRFGLVGIVKEGLDVQPKEGQLMIDHGIWIHGERITAKLFDSWLNSIPELAVLEDKTIILHTPTEMSS